MIKTIIIEDEKQSREVLQLMLENYRDIIELVDCCDTPLKGIESIQRYAPQLVFLDIEMPRMNGFQMLKKLETINFDVVFTTAYDKYAINAIKISALDYLLKPIDKEELSAAIQKCIHNVEQKYTRDKMDILFKNLTQHNALDRTITLTSVDGIRFIKMKDIIRLEANGRYTKFYLLNKEVVLASRTLGDFEEALSSNEFFRIHEAHIINLLYIDRFHKGNNYVLLSDKTELPLARRR
ncbi:MAG TPA: LytTR family DNA-binding domain-containing protein, partial [Hanamia sp.]|nr:LytTR family DNA-binding domain-containing protein [Hanamia sp.]